MEGFETGGPLGNLGIYANYTGIDDVGVLGRDEGGAI